MPMKRRLRGPRPPLSGQPGTSQRLGLTGLNHSTIAKDEVFEMSTFVVSGGNSGYPV